MPSKQNDVNILLLSEAFAPLMSLLSSSRVSLYFPNLRIVPTLLLDALFGFREMLSQLPSSFVPSTGESGQEHPKQMFSCNHRSFGHAFSCSFLCLPFKFAIFLLGSLFFSKHYPFHTLLKTFSKGGRGSSGDIR